MGSPSFSLVSLFVLNLLHLSIRRISGHSVSWGYKFNCSVPLPCDQNLTVTVFSGCYHDTSGTPSPAVTVNEGYLEWTPTNANGTVTGPSHSAIFDQLYIEKRPPGLIDGVTHFYADFNVVGKLYPNNATLVATSVATTTKGQNVNGAPKSWQGRSITIKPGYYRIYYDTALSVFDAVFEPKPGILYGLVMYLGCPQTCIKPGGKYAFGIASSDSPTRSPTRMPTSRNILSNPICICNLIPYPSPLGTGRQRLEVSFRVEEWYYSSC